LLSFTIHPNIQVTVSHQQLTGNSRFPPPVEQSDLVNKRGGCADVWHMARARAMTCVGPSPVMHCTQYTQKNSFSDVLAHHTPAGGALRGEGSVKSIARVGQRTTLRNASPGTVYLIAPPAPHCCSTSITWKSRFCLGQLSSPKALSRRPSFTG
jgi:hypothetical protein